MKIAVYTIFKNEAQFVERWLNSAKEADYIIAIDTGSTDRTADDLKAHAAFLGAPLAVLNCAVVPWRFDEARNFSLHAIPADADICVCLDMDEIMTEGWRAEIEKAFKESPETTRLRYNYIWNWNLDGSTGLTYHADKIHRRAGYRWVGPVHETLARDKRAGAEIQKFIASTLIEHHPDDTKPRTQYFPLLELAVAERPEDDRMAHYYGRELYFYRHYDEAIAELKRHLSLKSATWGEERAASCRYIGDCYWAKNEPDEAIAWFENAIDESRGRESYVRLAQAHRALGNWRLCVKACRKALEFTARPNSYLNDPVTWSDWPAVMLAEAEEKLKAAPAA